MYFNRCFSLLIWKCGLNEDRAVKYYTIVVWTLFTTKPFSLCCRKLCIQSEQRTCRGNESQPKTTRECFPLCCFPTELKHWTPMRNQYLLCVCICKSKYCLTEYSQWTVEQVHQQSAKTNRSFCETGNFWELIINFPFLVLYPWWKVMGKMFLCSSTNMAPLHSLHEQDWNCVY